jgi:hypothetical protein
MRGHTHVGYSKSPETRAYHVPFAFMVPKSGCPETGRALDGAHIDTLGSAIDGMADKLLVSPRHIARLSITCVPGDQILAVIDWKPGKVFECGRRDKVTQTWSVTDRWIRIEAG